MNTLITIPFSHFCEKARWALDWCGVPYVEQGHLPGLHVRPTRRAGGRTVPILVRDDGGVIADSSEILRWADARAPEGRKLLPAAGPARATADGQEDEFDEALGPATRLWAYSHGLRDRAMLRSLVSPSFPRRRDRAALAVLLPLVAPLIGRRYGATPAAGARAEGVITDVFARVSAQLAARPYLAGERFGAADLTFSALGGGILLLRENRWLNPDVVLTKRMGEFIGELRSTRAGGHIARCYREHRV